MWKIQWTEEKSVDSSSVTKSLTKIINERKIINVWQQKHKRESFICEKWSREKEKQKETQKYVCGKPKQPGNK